MTNPFEVISEKLERIERMLSELTSEQNAEAYEETYITPNEACGMLGVDRSTLWRWDKADYLKPISVGGKRRYRMSDLERISKGGRS